MILAHLRPDINGDGLRLQGLVQAVAGGPVAAGAQVEVAVPDERLPVGHPVADGEPLGAVQQVPHLRSDDDGWIAVDSRIDVKIRIRDMVVIAPISDASAKADSQQSKSASTCKHTAPQAELRAVQAACR